jgi:hypothetical protein
MNWLVFIVPLTLSLCAAGQIGTPDAVRHKPVKSASEAVASVKGIVTNALTGKPLDGVHVKLVSYDANKSPVAAYGAITSNGGHFSILRIPPAGYSIMLERPGFIFVPNSKRGVAMRGALPVKAGDQIRDLALEMLPRSIISGHVFDEYGDTVMNAQVIAISVTPKETFGLPAFFITNDLGEFRLSVPPGKYYVQATTGRRDEAADKINDAAEARYVNTYYPSAPDVAAAVPLEPKPGRELGDVDITLTRSPVFTIRGIVPGVSEGCRVSVHADGDKKESFGAIRLSAHQSAGADAQGKFQIGPLGSGDYLVYAQAFCNDLEWQSSMVGVTVADSNIEGMNLTLAPGADVTGKIEIAGKTGKSPLGESLTVELRPIGTESFDRLRTANVLPDGLFTIKNVFPERYRVQVSSLPENGFVKSINVNQSPALDGVLDFSGGADGINLRITLGLNGAKVAGALSYKDDTLAPFAEVLLFPDREDFDVQEIQWYVSGADGAYRFNGLAPGRYKLLAMKPVSGYVGQDRDVLKRHAGQADVIEVKEGEELRKDLKLVEKEETDDQ